ncbi:MAG TPA: DUF3109 family protein [Ignavibacteria bacterium]|nr:DUF3109 family protein [Ignavibacteria bacterium]
MKEYLIDDRIFNEKFSCDLSACKGACCVTPGTLGAPVTEEELKVIESLTEKVLNLLEPDKQNVILQHGIYDKEGGKYYLSTLNANDCVFSYYDVGIAKCIFQKLYSENKIDFKKPLSCDLFPIRISKLFSLKDGEKYYMRYEKCAECIPAVKKGNEENITIFEYCNDALKRIMTDEELKRFKNGNT